MPLVSYHEFGLGLSLQYAPGQEPLHGPPVKKFVDAPLQSDPLGRRERKLDDRSLVEWPPELDSALGGQPIFHILRMPGVLTRQGIEQAGM